ncbi:hypothetical protein [Bradyrhizobium sp. Ec3.3]|nr:hypothetical protein [Bradyrhizobium sp. Ec3.3]
MPDTDATGGAIGMALALVAANPASAAAEKKERQSALPSKPP